MHQEVVTLDSFDCIIVYFQTTTKAHTIEDLIIVKCSPASNGGIVALQQGATQEPSAEETAQQG